MPGRRLRFGPFEVDQGAQVILRDGEPLAVGQRGAAILEALLGRPGEVLTKAELMDAAWPDVTVEESNLSVQVAALRKALGPSPRGGEWIATIPRIGYRFIDPGARGAGQQSDGPSIAVLPLANLSPDPDQAFFADGLAEEIITRLSKLSGLLVIARHSSFAFRGSAVDFREVAEALNVRYVLTGSVRTSGDRVRMSVQLADAETRAQLWAESYDRQLTDVFAIQDDVAKQIVAALEVKLSPAEKGRLAAGKTRDLAALGHFIRGSALIDGTHLNLEVFGNAVEAFEKALDIDPAYGLAYSQLAMCHVLDYGNRWTADPDGSLREARRYADRGLALEPDEAEPHSAVALVAMMENNIEELVRENEATLAINPNHARSHTFRGNILIAQGNPQRAIEHMEHAMRVEPSAHQIQIHHLGLAYFYAGKYETAAALFRERILLVPTTDMTRGALASTLGHLGQIEEARRVWADLMAINPNYSLAERLKRGLQLQPRERERAVEGLRLAGLPTGETH
jgi:TolB-like protein